MHLFPAVSGFDFYPRPPRGGRLGLFDGLFPRREFLSTPSARRATLLTVRNSSPMRYFYPRPPRGGRRKGHAGMDCLDLFLSTPSARRATRSFELSVKLSDISIHALREEGDVPPRASFSSSFYFYPRPPRGGRRLHYICTMEDETISIHALREEGDVRHGWSRPIPRYFYPRPPRGGRLFPVFICFFGSLFLSTPSARRATLTALVFFAV